MVDTRQTARTQSPEPRERTRTRWMHGRQGALAPELDSDDAYVAPAVRAVNGVAAMCRAIDAPCMSRHMSHDGSGAGAGGGRGCGVCAVCGGAPGGARQEFVTVTDTAVAVALPAPRTFT